MAQALALDFGIKRTGIAVTDDMKMIASGLKTVETKELMPFLKDYIHKNKVDVIVIGEPKHIDGNPMALEKNIGFLVEDLNKIFPSIKIERIDERFTSKMAFQTMIDSGLSQKKRRNKALIDEVSATIILQNYLY
ncbi:MULTISPECIES: Holliday junction resolvase RuvX [Psychroflexus]|uniref:Putative pre-16S rRNA nuclease n=1 Tax=Psychroflexus halocasei TaxID=908615 RepID=A0A1H3X4E3_9FLAO|nr:MULTISPECIES: Holliday junction resolvase RuvX [Psychroflexus]PJX20744.1 Holliday junction resolvase RuvX [Psychroflexus sp. S27]SDZ94256.1 putative holliday junction resolvase [Psychroflexus halocasei]